ncbi:small G signaling modulator 1 isoform X1 [Labeo rohita]|uniref:Small G signaling modulator 1 isoform X1 n=2 Tax=Labeo rohita TaxID=84645 RepID=A0A498NG93_LABRO|nr:small G signaling modulator 1 isoform X1 [Labeo rohita]
MATTTAEAETRQRLLRNVKKEVKQIMEEAVTRKFVHEDSSHIVSFCAAVEACVLHGLKRRAAGFLRSNKIAALFTKVGKSFPPAEELCRKAQELELVFESKRSQSLSYSESTRKIPKVPNFSPQAVRYVWIHTALIEKVLDKIVLYLVENSSKFYEKEAILMDPVDGPILASLLVGPCALEYTKMKTADHFWTDPSADELVQRHRIHSGHCRQDSPIKRPALCIQKRHSSSSMDERPSPSPSARDYVESLHQNSRATLLFGKNNVLRDDMEAIPGYLSLHQTADCMTLKWTPNQLMNGSVGDLDYERSVYWDYAMTIRLEEIVYLHCHQQVDCGGTVVLVSQDGIQRPPLRFPRGGHLLQFLSCLENGLLPHGQLDPPLWSQRGKGKVFPKLKKRCPQGSSDSVSDKEEEEATDYVFRIIFPNSQSEFGLAYCRHLSTVRTHLSGLVNHTIVEPDVPTDAYVGLTTEVWQKFLQDCGSYEEKELLRLVYFGGVEPSLRKEVWPFLLGHYQFGMSETERKEVDEQMRACYEQTMSEWLGCEAIVRQREKEQHAVAIAKCSSGASIDSTTQRIMHRDSTISNESSQSCSSGRQRDSRLQSDSSSSTQVFESVEEVDQIESEPKGEDTKQVSKISNGTPQNETSSPDSGLPSSRNFSVTSVVTISERKKATESSDKRAEVETGGLKKAQDASEAPASALSHMTKMEASKSPEKTLTSENEALTRHTETDIPKATEVMESTPAEPKINENRVRVDIERSHMGTKDSRAIQEEPLVTKDHKISDALEQKVVADKLVSVSKDENTEKETAKTNEASKDSKTWVDEVVTAVKRKTPVLPKAIATEDVTKRTMHKEMQRNAPVIEETVVPLVHEAFSTREMSEAQDATESDESPSAIEMEEIPTAKVSMVWERKSSPRSKANEQTTVPVLELRLEEAHGKPSSDKMNSEEPEMESLCPQLDSLAVNTEKNEATSPVSSIGTTYSQELLDLYTLNLHRIDKDVQRCDRNYWYFTPANLEKLRNIMCSYIWQHLEIGYVQGMCDLLAPLLVILDDEAMAFSCFTELMKRMNQNFPHGGAMDTHFANMRSLIQILDAELFELMHQNGDYTHFYFCYRWFLLDFKRELVYDDVFAVWEVIWAAKCVSSSHFVLFIALALVEIYRDIILENNMDFTDIIKFFNEMAEHHNIKQILTLARDLVCKVMELTIKLMGGEPQSLEVSGDLTVRELKQRIYQRFQALPSKQMLFVENGKRIKLEDDSRSLRSYDLSANSVVILVIAKSFQVLVKNETGKIESYDVTVEETVDQLQTKIENKAGVPVDQQKLIYNCKTLGSGKKLQEYGIKKGSTIYLTLRLRSG